jgi:hypothetical protein
MEPPVTLRVGAFGPAISSDKKDVEVIAQGLSERIETNYGTGQAHRGRRELAKAIEAGGDAITLKALDDPNLEPIWKAIG